MAKWGDDRTHEHGAGGEAERRRGETASALPDPVGHLAAGANSSPAAAIASIASIVAGAASGADTSSNAMMYEACAPRSQQCPQSPQSPQWMAAQGAVALTPIYDGAELQVVDFASPSSPQTTSAKLGSCHPMSVAVYQGELAFVTCDSPGGLAEVSLATTGSPAYLGIALSGTVFNVVATSGNYLYAADENGNFETIGQ